MRPLISKRAADDVMAALFMIVAAHIREDGRRPPDDIQRSLRAPHLQLSVPLRPKHVRAALIEKKWDISAVRWQTAERQVRQKTSLSHNRAEASAR